MFAKRFREGGEGDVYAVMLKPYKNLRTQKYFFKLRSSENYGENLGILYIVSLSLSFSEAAGAQEETPFNQSIN